MSKKVFCNILLVVLLFLAGTLSVVAQGPEPVYVDPNRSPAGNEDGTQANPYSTIKEGEAYARSLPDGGELYVKQPDGTWKLEKSVPSVASGATGALLPRATLYILIAILAVVLILIGWGLLRRTDKLQGSARLRPKL